MFQVKYLAKLYNRDLSCCVGQCYDGAANMSSVNVGCQAVVKSKAKFNSHCLNLAISHSCEIQQVRNMIGAINEVYYFFHNSPKRQSFFERVLAKKFPSKSRKNNKGLSKTLKDMNVMTIISMHCTNV